MNINVPQLISESDQPNDRLTPKYLKDNPMLDVTRSWRCYLNLIICVSLLAALHGCTSSLSLYEAVKANDLPKAQQLLAEGADPNERSAETTGSTGLHEAARSGQNDMVALLVGRGADVNARDDRGMTPLHWAAEKGWWKTAEFLVKHGARLDEFNHTGNTPLLLAISNSQLEVLKFLLRAGANVDLKSKKGKTPLHEAIYMYRGEIEIVGLMVNRGVDINAKNEIGLQPLNLAVILGKQEIADFLLSKGGRIDDVSNEGRTSLLSAISLKDVKGAMFLINAGANAKQTDSNGNTPLHLAVQQGMVTVVKALLDHGADPNAQDKKGETPLLSAVGSEEGALDITKLLIEKGAEFNLKNPRSNQDALQIAIENGKEEVAHLLVAHGANTGRLVLSDAVRSRGYGDLFTRIRWPGHWAVRKGTIDDIRRELAKGFPIESRDDNGRTMLHYAAARGVLEVVQYLAEKGADLMVQDGSGVTPFLIAASGHHSEVVDWMKGRGIIEQDLARVGASSKDLINISSEITPYGSAPVYRLLADRFSSGGDKVKAREYYARAADIYKLVAESKEAALRAMARDAIEKDKQRERGELFGSVERRAENRNDLGIYGASGLASTKAADTVLAGVLYGVYTLLQRSEDEVMKLVDKQLYEQMEFSRVKEKECRARLQ